MSVSFSAGVKNELCRLFPQKKCCALAECFGILLYCNSFGGEGLRIITENREFAAMIPKLFQKAFRMEFDVQPTGDSTGKLVFQMTRREKLRTLMESYGFSPNGTLSLHVNFSVIEEECCRAAFLRGAFLAGGSVTDPEKGYHLELSTTHQSVARETFTLMREALGFSPKIVRRGGGQILYLKQSDQISDCLTYLGAPLAAMGIMEAKLEKDLNNQVNRRCNCDDANTSKVVDAAQEQLTAIRVLREQGALEHLPPKLLQAAEAREKHPAASLSELAEMMEPPITKPAMNHRMKRIVSLSKEERP